MGTLLVASYNSWADVNSRLVDFANNVGTNNENGTIERENFLGFQWKAIALAAPQEAHAWIRPIIVKLCGPSSYQRLGDDMWLQKQALMFFDNRTSIEIPLDIQIWVTTLQHQVMTGITLTVEEAAEFVEMPRKLLLGMTFDHWRLTLEAHLNFFSKFFGQTTPSSLQLCNACPLCSCLFAANRKQLYGCQQHGPS
jgi:hypothetical protein